MAPVCLCRTFLLNVHPSFIFFTVNRSLHRYLHFSTNGKKDRKVLLTAAMKESCFLWRLSVIRHHWLLIWVQRSRPPHTQRTDTCQSSPSSCRSGECLRNEREVKDGAFWRLSPLSFTSLKTEQELFYLYQEKQQQQTSVIHEFLPLTTSLFLSD